MDGVEQVACPNMDERSGDKITLIVIHNISLPAGHFGNSCIRKLFCNELDTATHVDFGDLVEMRVSSHLFVRRDGSVLQFVPFNKRAWHAGESIFNGQSGCNDFSIGIELEGTDDSGFRESQ
jgi:AmpD protein